MGIFNRSNAKHDRTRPDSSNGTSGDPTNVPAPVHDAPASSGHVKRTPKRPPMIQGDVTSVGERLVRQSIAGQIRDRADQRGRCGRMRWRGRRPACRSDRRGGRSDGPPQVRPGRRVSGGHGGRAPAGGGLASTRERCSRSCGSSPNRAPPVGPRVPEQPSGPWQPAGTDPAGDRKSIPGRSACAPYAGAPDSGDPVRCAHAAIATTNVKSTGDPPCPL